MLRYATEIESDVTKLVPLIDAMSENDVDVSFVLEPINIHPALPAAVLQASILEIVVA